jgi:hypothetical protein
MMREPALQLRYVNMSRLQPSPKIDYSAAIIGKAGWGLETY